MDVAASMKDCEKACDPMCYDSSPLIRNRGPTFSQRYGKAGEGCTRHAECEGKLLCDYTRNTKKVNGYTLGVCRKPDCTEQYGMGAVYHCDEERDDPKMCGPTSNWRWESCRATCD